VFIAVGVRQVAEIYVWAAVHVEDEPQNFLGFRDDLSEAKSRNFPMTA